VSNDLSWICTVVCRIAEFSVSVCGRPGQRTMRATGRPHGNYMQPERFILRVIEECKLLAGRAETHTRHDDITVMARTSSCLGIMIGCAQYQTRALAIADHPLGTRLNNLAHIPKQGGCHIPKQGGCHTPLRCVSFTQP